MTATHLSYERGGVGEVGQRQSRWSGDGVESRKKKNRAMLSVTIPYAFRKTGNTCSYEMHDAWYVHMNTRSFFSRT